MAKCPPVDQPIMTDFLSSTTIPPFLTMACKPVFAPGIRIAYVLDRAVDEADLGTESVIDADGQHVVGEEVGGLILADCFSGKRHVPAAMDHKRYK